MINEDIYRAAIKIIEENIKADRDEDAIRWRFVSSLLASLTISITMGVVFSVLVNQFTGEYYGHITISHSNYLVRIVDLTKSIHWMVWMTAMISSYVLISFIIELMNKLDNLRIYFRIPKWSELQSFGSQQLAKISYISLLAIPLFILLIKHNLLKFDVLQFVEIPINIKITYFISLYLSFALFIFTVGAPKELKSKRKLSDQIKDLSIHIENSSGSVVNLDMFNIEHIDESIDRSRLVMRSLCWLFYFLAVFYAIILLFRSIIYVLYA